jgi:hypothetical protein
LDSTAQCRKVSRITTRKARVKCSTHLRRAKHRLKDSTRHNSPVNKELLRVSTRNNSPVNRELLRASTHHNNRANTLLLTAKFKVSQCTHLNRARLVHSPCTDINRKAVKAASLCPHHLSASNLGKCLSHILRKVRPHRVKCNTPLRVKCSTHLLPVNHNTVHRNSLKDGTRRHSPDTKWPRKVKSSTRLSKVNPCKDKCTPLKHKVSTRHHNSRDNK